MEKKSDASISHVTGAELLESGSVLFTKSFDDLRALLLRTTAILWLFEERHAQPSCRPGESAAHESGVGYLCGVLHVCNLICFCWCHVKLSDPLQALRAQQLSLSNALTLSSNALKLSDPAREHLLHCSLIT